MATKTFQEAVGDLCKLGGFEGWFVVVPRQRELEDLQRSRAHWWSDLLREIHRYKATRAARERKAIADWKHLCFSDSDMD